LLFRLLDNLAQDRKYALAQNPSDKANIQDVLVGRSFESSPICGTSTIEKVTLVLVHPRRPAHKA
jgi:hypothetical protein